MQWCVELMHLSCAILNDLHTQLCINHEITVFVKSTSALYNLCNGAMCNMTATLKLGRVQLELSLLFTTLTIHFDYFNYSGL